MGDECRAGGVRNDGGRQERRHLDIKIACKVNTGSQQVKCSCRSASATALLFVMCRGCFRMI